jgi:DNA-binding winged helix-turn-helix (wHTH) protein
MGLNSNLGETLSVVQIILGLRSLIEIDPSSPEIIINVKGKGYKIGYEPIDPKKLMPGLWFDQDTFFLYRGFKAAAENFSYNFGGKNRIIGEFISLLLSNQILTYDIAMERLRKKSRDDINTLAKHTRKHIEPNPSDPIFIVTVPHIGYKATYNPIETVDLGNDITYDPITHFIYKGKGTWQATFKTVLPYESALLLNIILEQRGTTTSKAELKEALGIDEGQIFSRVKMINKYFRQIGMEDSLVKYFDPEGYYLSLEPDRLVRFSEFHFYDFSAKVVYEIGRDNEIISVNHLGSKTASILEAMVKNPESVVTLQDFRATIPKTTMMQVERLVSNLRIKINMYKVGYELFKKHEKGFCLQHPVSIFHLLTEDYLEIEDSRYYNRSRGEFYESFEFGNRLYVELKLKLSLEDKKRVNKIVHQNSKDIVPQLLDLGIDIDEIYRKA